MRLSQLDKPCCALPVLALALLAGNAQAAFNSGSTGTDGAFSPTVNTQVQLPPSGVLNYTSMNIPVGVTVTFAKNATNTPVVILVGGDATIAGTIDIQGGAAAAAGAAGDGNIGDDGTPGVGGPGGYDGGQGGKSSATVAERESQAGQGPGGGPRSGTFNSVSCGGAGGGFGTAGITTGRFGNCAQAGQGGTGATYGSSTLLPLIGGSGGAGGTGGASFRGAGGGGAGGAILVAVSGSLTVSGAIRADGGTGGSSSGSGSGALGGGGSGGAIRLVATAVGGNGTISAAGADGVYTGNHNSSGDGGVGRIRLEAETFTRTAVSTPTHSFAAPGAVFVAGLPSLRISKVGGVDAPVAPTGNADIALPEGTANPVAVEFATTGVPLGNTVSVVVTPAYGATSSAVSTAISGTESAGTASANVSLPTGPSTLLATVSYSVAAAAAKKAPFAELATQDDPIARVALEAAADGGTRTVLHTQSGRRIEWSGVAVTME